MASLTQWAWVWVNSRSWWWTGRPGMLRSMGLQRVGHNWATELNWTDAEAETPILWPPDVKNWLIWKDPDAGKDWRWEEKGVTEDEMVGWHHWLDGYEFQQAPGVGDGQGSLECCSPWGRKESDTTERLNWTELKVWTLSTTRVPLLTWRTLSLKLPQFCYSGSDWFGKDLQCSPYLLPSTKSSLLWLFDLIVPWFHTHQETSTVFQITAWWLCILIFLRLSRFFCPDIPQLVVPFTLICALVWTINHLAILSHPAGSWTDNIWVPWAPLCLPGFVNPRLPSHCLSHRHSFAKATEWTPVQRFVETKVLFKICFIAHWLIKASYKSYEEMISKMKTEMWK